MMCWSSIVKSIGQPATPPGHVLATQCLLQRKPKTLAINAHGNLAHGVTSKDLILAITSPRHVMNEQYRAILTNTDLQGAVEPLMPDLTDHMSARQLMDLTAFLNQIYDTELSSYGEAATD